MPAFFGTDPDGIAVVPGRVFYRGAITERVPVIAIPAGKVVADDAMLRRIQSGRNRVMVGESQAGPGRLHGLRDDAATREAVECRRVGSRTRVPAEAVDGNQYQIGLVDRGRRVDAAGSGREQSPGGKQGGNQHNERVNTAVQGHDLPCETSYDGRWMVPPPRCDCMTSCPAKQPPPWKSLRQVAPFPGRPARSSLPSISLPDEPAQSMAGASASPCTRWRRP